jgi:lipopolysaccharide transport system ATP-binding protein
MSDTQEPIVSVKGVSKRYIIGHRAHNSHTLRDVMAGSIKNLLNRDAKVRQEEFWALRKVDFEVFKGETLGIIGSNGAGKSTILKILSRIIEPTEGEVKIQGRVASLLEVGTGFHPELTGRENVFFNGSVLGMSREEIIKRFDEIVAFSEIGKFIDTPVKFYSSGMYVRLAFAIAAHLDPDVLIIDEALAVGDVNFQQKCIDKMRDSARSGKTVLFVTHSMNIVEEICDRAVFLKNGKVEMIGDTSKVVSTYLGTTSQNLDTKWEVKGSSYVHRPDNPIKPISLKLTTADGKPIERTVHYKEGLVATVTVDVTNPSKDMSVGVSFYDEFNNRLFRTSLTDVDTNERIKLKAGKNKLAVTVPLQDLREGAFIVALDCDIYRKDWVHNPYHTPVRTKFFLQNDGSKPPQWDVEREGLTKPILEWRTAD